MTSSRHHGLLHVLLFLSFFCLQLYAFSTPDVSENHALSSALTARANSAGGQADFTCGPGRPCSNGACCGVSGWCGYGPTYCGDGCQSNCNATAPCGQYAKVPGQGCPLNVCCSEWGFCGTTTDFCSKGCQSHCDQPKPSASASNPRQRVIGYWEAWNGDHPCGKMPVGQIPVTLLTHLNIAFGYISPGSYQVTNMPGVPTDLYQSIGNMKARNPALKVMIALGGWTFNDPGTWQSVFPSLVSSAANRQTFIRNLLGFLSQYGYDGVDFDWEYPGADDRGGSDSDGKNYTLLMKELKEAIRASGRDYIVTFTAPTSFWYLRHFDLANMVEYVDWVNLMSYDLHGIWDSDNPIGSHVFAHTNLTEIDLALDLFWRVNVEPSKIVLGLGFYGRSFNLLDSNCWQPGCDFHGPGAAGPCTDTPGILSYYEVTEILAKTGATPYLDEKAGVRYLVYGGNSWISFDDEITLKMKVDYAAKMGLSGLMIWAVDLDDSRLSALEAVTGGEAPDRDSDFSLVDLKYLFPSQYLPPEDTKPAYGLVNIGSGASMGDTDPNGTGFVFILVTDESHAASSLRKRDGQPEPFTFIDCPRNVMDFPLETVHKARVVCLNDDLKACFRVMERGVEGTLVEMPANCAPNTIARAISLEKAAGEFVNGMIHINPRSTADLIDQYVPPHIAQRNPTSAVYEFSFDFDMSLGRRDSNETRIRIDASNVPGFWDSTVNAPGIQDDGNKGKRYFAPTDNDWEDHFANFNRFTVINATGSADKLQRDMSAPVVWNADARCIVDNKKYAEGFGAYVDGEVNANLLYGYSVLITRGFLYTDIHKIQSSAFLKVTGETDLTFGIGGMGSIDVAPGNAPNPVVAEGTKVSFGNAGSAGSGGSAKATFQPYYELSYQIGSYNDTTNNPQLNSTTVFNGLMNARVKSDLGDFTVYFPNKAEQDSANDKRKKNQISVQPKTNILYSSTHQGQISVTSYLTIGLKIDGHFFAGRQVRSLVPDISLRYVTTASFKYGPEDGHSDASCSNYEVSTSIDATVEQPDKAFWDERNSYVVMATDRQKVDGQCYNNVMKRGLEYETPTIQGAHSLHEDNRDPAENTTSTDKLEARGGPSDVFPGWGFRSGEALLPDIIFKGADSNEDEVPKIFRATDAKIGCKRCASCMEEDEDKDRCCGCANMDELYGYRDMPACDTCNPDDGTYVSGISAKRSITNQTKKIAASAAGEFADLEDDDSDSDSEYHMLDKRVNGVATLSSKKVSVCNTKVWGLGLYRYPAFPANPAFAWDGIEGGRWDGIDKYWGNNSDDCADWGTSALVPADQVFLASGARVRAKYQTEHVFEGQLIGDFFTLWLATGTINNQNPPAQNPVGVFSCADTDRYVKSIVTPPFQLDNNNVPFIQLLLAELGSIAHMDRLTIYLARPNRMKGGMFMGNRAVDPIPYAAMTGDEQLAAVKEMGMVFTYLNDADVRRMFCDTYEAIYSRLQDLETWYANHGPGGVINFRDQWKRYINVVLDSLVNRGRAQFDLMYRTRRRALGLILDLFYERKWQTNRFTNRQLIRHTISCPNL